jgi:sugar phosphate isomerase/epimerase
MLEFLAEAGVYATIDTTHCAQSAVDIVKAARILKDRVKTIHLSDYAHEKAHVYIGEGNLDFRAFYGELDITSLYLTTAECAVPFKNEELAIEKTRNTMGLIMQNVEQ